MISQGVRVLAGRVNIQGGVTFKGDLQVESGTTLVSFNLYPNEFNFKGTGFLRYNEVRKDQTSENADYSLTSGEQKYYIVTTDNPDSMPLLAKHSPGDEPADW